MKKVFINLQFLLATLLLASFSIQNKETCSLTIEVKNLRNSKGVVQFALYNKDGSIPDERFKNYYRILKGKIINGSATITFNKLPAGRYAVNILHDEDNDGNIKKGLILPKEGIGFSNYQTIGLSNRPTFTNASFDLNGDKKFLIKVIYL